MELEDNSVQDSVKGKRCRSDFTKTSNCKRLVRCDASSIAENSNYLRLAGEKFYGPAQCLRIGMHALTS